MAYSRKRARKYFRRVKRSFRKFKRSYGSSLAPMGSRRGFYGPGAKKRGRVHVELKKYDSGDTTQGTPSDPEVVPQSFAFTLTADDETDSSNVRSIFQPAVGSAFNQRIGRIVVIKSIRVTMVARPSTATATDGQAIMLMVVLDKQPNGSLINPAVQEILGNGGTGNTNCNVWSGNNLDNRARFQTIMRKLVQIPSTLSTGGVPLAPTTSEVICDMFKKTNIRVTFNGGNNGLPSDIATNKLLIFAIGNNATNAWEWRGTTRVRFIDP